MAKKAHIGIDLHTNNFTACYLRKGNEPEYKIYTISNDGLEDFCATLSKKDEIALEATSNASYFYDQVKKYVRHIEVVASGQFYIISKSIKKTDRNDAEALAFYLSRDMLPKARIRNKACQDTLSLVDMRSLLVRTRKSLINKTHSLLVRNGIKIEKGKLGLKSGFNKYVWCHDWSGTLKFELNIIYEQLQSINQNIEKLDQEIESKAETLPGYENIMSIKGIGPLSAAILLSVIGDVNDFKRSGQLCSYFGIVPRVKQSNDTDQTRRITKRGSKIGRSTLVCSMFVAIQYNPYLKAFYERIKKRRGSSKAMIATSRKFLIIIYNTLKNDWVFEDFSKYQYRQRLQTQEQDAV